MIDDETVAIGRFAQLSGLSIHALRHYDDIGLLAPANVDAVTGYRRYSLEQIPVAKLIRSLRWIDLPLDQVREVLATPTGPRATDVLTSYRQLLSRKQSNLHAQVEAVDQLIEKGITMPTTASTCRPVQIKIAVRDEQEAIEFYGRVFGFRYEVTRRTPDEHYSSFVFGEYGQDGFFLMHVLTEADVDRPGTSTFGVLVDDLDHRHATALKAGGTEMVSPQSPLGMPRSSAITDPSGNWIWLYQT